jgi:hydroxyacylglutathione hydrolase
VKDGDVFDFAGHAGAGAGRVGPHGRAHRLSRPDAAAVFTGDSLMALGCGRLFEGTAPQMWESLSKLAALPPETLVCSGHEYTAVERPLRADH